MSLKKLMHILLHICRPERYNIGMSTPRHILAQITGRTVARGMSLLGRESTALPGYIAERVAPDVLSTLVQSGRFKERIIVTGTNGKTTTTHLIQQILTSQGRKVLSNASGSNLTRGVTTSLLSKKHQKGADSLLLEVDEASMPKVCAAVQPTQIIVLNLFRDQLDRYGEVDITQQFIVAGILKTKAELILCADDPWVASLGVLTKRKAHFFGIDNKQLAALPNDRAADMPVSPVTKLPYRYSQRYFSHLGVYESQDKSFVRPDPALSIRSWNERPTGGMSVAFTFEGKNYHLETAFEGTYSLYNLAAAILACHQAGIGIEAVQPVVSHTQAAFGRQEVLSFEGRTYQFFLIKNPTGFNQVIQSALYDVQDKRPVVFVINDNFADGRDISWLWDVAMEDLKVPEPVYVSGTRAYDMALRLEYAGIGCLVVQDPMTALREASHGKLGVRVLPTYTGLLSLRKGMALGLKHVQEKQV